MAYKCGYLTCNEAFETKGELLQHVRTRHKNDSGATVYKCSYCDRYFNTKYELMRHVGGHGGGRVSTNRDSDYFHNSRYGKSGSPWATNEEREAVRLFKQGKSINDIANILSREPAAIAHRLIELNIIGYGNTYEEGRFWGNGEIQQLTKEYSEGKTIEEMAETHDRSKNAILHRLLKLRLVDVNDNNVFIPFSGSPPSISIINNQSRDNNNGRNGDDMDEPKRPGREIDYTAPRGVEIPKFDIVNESLWDLISGRTGKAEWRLNITTVQQKLERTWEAFDKSITGRDGADLGLIKGFDEFKETQMGIPEAESNAANLKEEWNESLTSLSNLLTKIQGEEIRLWDITQGNRSNRSMKIKQKIIRTGIDEMNFNNMLDKIDTYPKLQSSAVVEKAIERLDAKRKEAQEAEELYNRRLKQANIYLNTAGRRIQQAETELSAFEKTLKRFKNEVENPPKRLFGLLPAISKIEVLVRSKIIEPYDDKIDTMEGQLKLIKEDLKEYKERRFKPIVTQKFAAIE